MEKTAYEALRETAKNLSEEMKKLKEEAAHTLLNKKEIDWDNEMKKEINLRIIPEEKITPKLLQSIEAENYRDPSYAFDPLLYSDTAAEPIKILLKAVKDILEQGLNLQEAKGAMCFIADALDYFVAVKNDKEPE